ncbi:hypothetical protein K438DRAFT_1746882 [Mycena galopus ATCC 62051]|nr:hypothetical protein K438DRAFT_1746882 [Mycena galopus ATCC 62051]
MVMVLPTFQFTLEVGKFLSRMYQRSKAGKKSPCGEKQLAPMLFMGIVYRRGESRWFEPTRGHDAVRLCIVLVNSKMTSGLDREQYLDLGNPYPHLVSEVQSEEESPRGEKLYINDCHREFEDVALPGNNTWISAIPPPPPRSKASRKVLMEKNTTLTIGILVNSKKVGYTGI